MGALREGGIFQTRITPTGAENSGLSLLRKDVLSREPNADITYANTAP
jgi:hypothetical protein